MNKILSILEVVSLTLILFFGACRSDQGKWSHENGNSDTLKPNAKDTPSSIKHYSSPDSLIQITFGGQNTYSTFAGNDSDIFFISYYKAWNTSCDQIFATTIPFDSNAAQPQHFGFGNNTYSRPVFNAHTNTLLYAYSKNTSLVSANDFYISLPKETELYIYNFKNKSTKEITNNIYFDGDATFSPDGKEIVCTSMRSGDPELWLLSKSGKYIKQLTHHEGFDGNASFSPDGKEIIYVSSTNDNEAETKDLIKKGKVDPAYLELKICNLATDSCHTLINPGKACLHPCFTPDGRFITFSSNYQSDNGLPFNLYITDLKGKNITLLEKGGTINDYPTFSADGNYFIFTSNRGKQIDNGLNLYFKKWNNKLLE